MGLASSSVHVSPVENLVGCLGIQQMAVQGFGDLEPWPNISSEMNDIHFWNSLEWSGGKAKITAK